MIVNDRIRNILIKIEKKMGCLSSAEGLKVNFQFNTETK